MTRVPLVSRCVVCKKSVELLCDKLKTVKKYYCKVCKGLVRTIKNNEE